MTKEEQIGIALSIIEKTIGYDIEPTKSENITNKIAELLSKGLQKNVTIKGDGLKEDMVVTVEDKKYETN